MKCERCGEPITIVTSITTSRFRSHSCDICSDCNEKLEKLGELIDNLINSFWANDDGENKYWFRNPDLFTEQPWRKWARNEYAALPFPRSPKDLSMSDLDLMLLNFGDTVGRARDADGRLRLVEVKQGIGKVEYAQWRMYQLLDRLLRMGDPKGVFYGGFYSLYWQPPDGCKVNGRSITMDRLAQFFLAQEEIEPMTQDDFKRAIRGESIWGLRI